MKKLVLGLAVAFALVGASSASAYTFSVNLTLGSAGADVVALQDMLIAGGHLVMPAGVSKGYFGALTQTAVAKWQAANGIAPAAGYFGPVSRMKASSAMPSTPVTPTTPSTTLNGGDGDFKNFDQVNSVDNETVEEGDSEKVLAFEFEADDSDLKIERVDVLFYEGALKPWKFFDEVNLYNGSKKVATVDASDEDNWDETSTDDEYELSFSGVNSVVKEGDEAEFSVEVVAQDNIDSDDLPQTWDVTVADDAIRALNGDGINVYNSDDTFTTSFDLEEADASDIDVTFKASENDDQTIEVDDKTDLTEEVLLYTFKVESKDGDLNIDEMTVDIATTSGSDLVEDVIKTVYLFIDGDEVAKESGDTTVTFEDLDYDLSEDEEVEVEIFVDVEGTDDGDQFTSGAGVQVTNVDIDYTDDQDDDYTETVDQDGGEVTFQTAGILVTSKTNSSSRVFTADDAGEKDRVEYTISFEVTAFGDEDIYVDKSVQNTAAPSAQGAGIAWASTTDSTGTTTVSSSIFSASGNTDDDTSNYYFVEEGESRTFTLKVTLEAGQDGAAGVRLTGINYDTDSTIDQYYTIDLSDYKVDPVSVNII